MQAIKLLPELPLAQVLDLALHAGLLVHLSGGDTERAAATMRRVALALGAARADTVVSSLNIGLTIERGNERDTAFRRAPHVGANFANLTELERLLEDLEAGHISAEQLQDGLDDVARRKPIHSRPLMAALIGLSCGAFAALFGGDLAAVLITTLGSALGVAVRFLLLSRGFKPVMFAIAASFTALLVVGLLRGLTATPDAALAASVLFLIPGVPLINGASDMLAANYLNGMVRLTMSAMIVLGIAIGVSVALRFVS
ncbi:threonine/serine exporter family protein [Chitinilyticum piscinae]|uniref:Threonine/serine exporter family protein n=1 Tax=Chitinilyticum piscinae TaxID=2866724 RepID=A0A8J7FFX7_9NEIS|nr:threonine/serine exporter family protein [Chitinilyticum piscinae]MBE9608320.1 threonine/serine exporter family protein [Chitinilyticum piscinae]